jgi:hypothetical protein
MIEVRPLRPADEEAYTAFLEGRGDALLYHSLPYRNLLVEHLGCRAEYLLAWGAGDVRGVLPVMWARAEGALVANSLPFHGSHGGVLAADPAAADALMGAWNERAADPGTAAATLVASPFGSLPDRPPVADLTDDRINQATSLAGVDGEPAVLARVDASARRNVAKARRLGAVIERDASALDRLAVLHRANLARIGGVAKDARFFAAVPGHFREGHGFDVYVARVEDRVVAALLVFWLGAAAEYFTPAIEHARRSDQPLAAVLARALTDAAARGLAWWNWGGTRSDQHGVRRFKAKWGARTVPYRYFIKVNDPDLLAERPDALRARFPGFYVAPYSALAPPRGAVA